MRNRELVTELVKVNRINGIEKLVLVMELWIMRMLKILGKLFRNCIFVRGLVKVNSLN